MEKRRNDQHQFAMWSVYGGSMANMGQKTGPREILSKAFPDIYCAEKPKQKPGSKKEQISAYDNLKQLKSFSQIAARKGVENPTMKLKDGTTFDVNHRIAELERDGSNFR